MAKEETPMLDALLIVTGIVAIFKILFPTKQERHERNLAHLQRMLGLRVDCVERERTSERYGLNWKDLVKLKKNKDENCYDVICSPVTRHAKVGFIMERAEQLASYPGHLPMTVCVDQIGSTKVEAPCDGVLVPVVASGPAKRGEVVAKFYTSKDRIDAFWKK